MKKLLLITLVLISSSVVFAQEMTRKEKKAARKAEQLEKTKVLVGSDAWQFDASQMMPTTGKSRSLTTSYNIVVKGNELNSYLPYVGRAYRADYGSTESPLIFKGEITEYKVEPGKKKGWNISFKTKNKNDILRYTLYVTESGSSTLNVNSNDRQPISFHGNLVEIEQEK